MHGCHSGALDLRIQEATMLKGPQPAGGIIFSRVSVHSMPLGQPTARVQTMAFTSQSQKPTLLSTSFVPTKCCRSAPRCTQALKVVPFNPSMRRSTTTLSGTFHATCRRVLGFHPKCQTRMVPFISMPDWSVRLPGLAMLRLMLELTRGFAR